MTYLQQDSDYRHSADSRHITQQDAKLSPG